jgi:hypothetical protein
VLFFAGVWFVPLGARADEVNGVYTVRLYSLRFAVEDIPTITGVDGGYYNVTLRQDGNSDAPVGVRMAYNYTAGSPADIYLSVEAGTERGEAFFEFKVHSYNVLRSWIVIFQGRGFAVPAFNVQADISIDGSYFYRDPSVTIPKSSVYDANDNPLYYLPDGTVVTSNGDVAIDSVDGVGDVTVRYVDGAFTNDLGTALTVSDLSVPVVGVSSGVVSAGNGTGAVSRDVDVVNAGMLDGVEHRYLLHDSRKIASITITDDVYKVHVTEYGGADYYILCRLVIKEPTFLQSIARFFVGSVIDNNLREWYTLDGKLIDRKAYSMFYPYVSDDPSEDFYNWCSLVTDSRSTLDRGLNVVGTIGDYINEIIIEGEPYNDNPAIDLSTGSVLYDDMGNPISKDGGQLKDVAGWPLISSDYYPCYYDDDGAYYSVDKTGAKLQMTIDSDCRLVDSHGYVIHSVIAELRDGKELYFLWMADGITSMPGQVEYNALTKGYTYKDLGGDVIPDDVILEPEISVDDRYTKHPEEAPMSTWDYIVMVVKIIAVVIVVLLAVWLVSKVVWLVRVAFGAERA